MQYALLLLFEKTRVVWSNLTEEDGQDLVEYALVCALVALGAIFGMQTLANGINAAFSGLASSLNSSV